MQSGTWADWFAAAGTIVASATAIVLAMRGSAARRNDLADLLTVRVSSSSPGGKTQLKVDYSAAPNTLFHNIKVHWFEFAPNLDASDGWKTELVAESLVGNQFLSRSIPADHYASKKPIYVSFQDAHGRQFVRDMRTGQYVKPEKVLKRTRHAIALN